MNTKIPVGDVIESEERRSNDSLVSAALDKDSGEPVHLPTPLIGKLVDSTPVGEPIVTHAFAPDRLLIARTTVRLLPQDIGKEVVLLFNEGKAGEPIITGVIQPPIPFDEPLKIASSEGISLRSGDAKLELRRDGHIFITGISIQNQAASAIRMNGASVKLN